MRRAISNIRKGMGNIAHILYSFDEMLLRSYKIKARAEEGNSYVIARKSILVTD